ncbi:hypothetical protein P8452_08494 [Trifolium repens]|nr:hypothetical protein P8452_08494 [Trifolium repens]
MNQFSSFSNSSIEHNTTLWHFSASILSHSPLFNSFPLPSTTPISRVQVGLHTNCLKGVQISTPFVLKKRKNAIFIASATADSNVADGASRIGIQPINPVQQTNPSSLRNRMT